MSPLRPTSRVLRLIQVLWGVRSAVVCLSVNAVSYLPMDLLSAVQAAVDRHKLLSSGDAVLASLSGGPDSVALLHLLTRLRKPLTLKLHAVYFNHGLRPRAAAKEEKFCRQLCARWHVKFEVVQANVPALARARKVGFEEAARDFRYEHLGRIADRIGASKIALGHQADDQAETILFRILRGSGRTGVLGIPITRDRFIRPLLNISRADIIAYLKQRQIAYCLDRSNDRTKYRRNLIRNRILPLLRTSVNPQVDQALRDLAETLGEEESFLDQMTRRVYRRTKAVSSGGKLMLDLQIYAGYPIWLRRRVLRLAIGELSGNSLTLDKRVTDRIDQAALTGGKGSSLSADFRVAVTPRHLVLFSPLTSGKAVPVIPDGAWRKIGSADGAIRAAIGKKTTAKAVAARRALRVAVDRDRLELPLSIRPIRPGDRFTPLGMRGRKKVGDYLTDRKLPVVWRDEVLAVCDQQGIVWLVGWDIADRMKIDEATTEVVTIEYRTVKTYPSQTV
jgi:tRNA(Ile)-lysidine synthase